jgi:hypothetical protein
MVDALYALQGVVPVRDALRDATIADIVASLLTRHVHNPAARASEKARCGHVIKTQFARHLRASAELRQM